VLGLSLVELLGGLGRTLEFMLARQAGDRAFSIGRLTPLLALFVILNLLSFWIFAWIVQEHVGADRFSVLGGLVFASAYFLASRLVFPSDPENFTDLDTHYFRVSRVVFAMLLVMVAVQWALLLSVPGLADRLITPTNIGLPHTRGNAARGVPRVRQPKFQTGVLDAASLRDSAAMNRFARIITFDSPHFPRHPRDAELANTDAMFGFALASHIGEALAERGITVTAYVAEDWGWYCEIRLPETAIAYGVAGGPDSDAFLIQFIPDKPYVRKLFRKIDISEPLARLQDDVFAILQAAPSSSPPEWSAG